VLPQDDENGQTQVLDWGAASQKAEWGPVLGGGLVQRVEKGRWRVTRGLCAGSEHRPCRALGAHAGPSGPARLAGPRGVGFQLSEENRLLGTSREE